MPKLPKLLITGATGFVGSHLVPRLIGEDQYEVHILERYVTGRYFNLRRDIATHFADLRDFATIRNEIKLLQPDVLIHLAAISPVSYSYDHPSEVIETNLLGTMNLLESCRQYCPDFKHAIIAGTTEEYGVSPNRPASEEALCIPNSPYSVSKHAASEYAVMMNKAYNFPATIMRATNSYGRKDDSHFFIEKAISQMINNSNGEVFLGEAGATRDFMYIDDHIDAYLNVLQNREKAIGDIFNFSTGNAKTLAEVTEEIVKLTGFRGQIVWNSIPHRPLDIIDHRINSQKARAVLGWTTKVSLDSGLAKTIEYWKSKPSRLEK